MADKEQCKSKYCGKILKEAGLRHTIQRHNVLDALITSEIPLSAQGIYSVLISSDRRMDLSTVYRTLETLEACNIVRKIIIESENVALYEYNESSHKHYLICLGCKKIKSIEHCPLNSFENSLSKETDFTIKGHSLNIYGYCSHCSDGKK